MPAGSGFFAVVYDKDECGAEEAGFWGCRFNADGNSTACCTVAINNKYDDIIIMNAGE